MQYVARELRVGPACSEDAMQTTGDMWRVKKYESRLCFAAFRLWLLHSVNIHTSFTSKRKGSNPDNRREVRISTSNENNCNYTGTEKVAKDLIASARFPENPWLVVGTSGSRVLTVHNQPNTDYSVQASVGDIRRKVSITILLHAHRHQSTSLTLNYNSWQEQQH